MYGSIHAGVYVALMRGLSQIRLLGTVLHQPSGHEMPFLANRNGFAVGLDLDPDPLTQGHVYAHESQANPFFSI